MSEVPFYDGPASGRETRSRGDFAWCIRGRDWAISGADPRNTTAVAENALEWDEQHDTCHGTVPT